MLLRSVVGEVGLGHHFLQLWRLAQFLLILWWLAASHHEYYVLFRLWWAHTIACQWSMKANLGVIFDTAPCSVRTQVFVLPAHTHRTLLRKGSIHRCTEILLWITVSMQGCHYPGVYARAVGGPDGLIVHVVEDLVVGLVDCWVWPYFHAFRTAWLLNFVQFFHCFPQFVQFY